MASSPQERRHYSRVSVHFSVFYRVDRPIEVRVRIGEDEVNAIMLDLSEGGVSVSTSRDIPLGALLSIKFTLINDHAAGEARTKSMFLDGEVRNNVLVAEREFRLGIQFNYMDDEDKAAIRQLVQMINSV